jgi:hypothetical protein
VLVGFLDAPTKLKFEEHMRKGIELWQKEKDENEKLKA